MKLVYRIVAGVALVAGFATQAAADDKCSSVNPRISDHTKFSSAFKCVDGTSVPITVD